MKPKILVVDDERDLVNLIRYNLQKEGYETICAYEGTTVAELVWSHKPDLVILDWMLPDRSGLDICKEIKSDSATKDIPIIMLTARSAEADRVSGFEMGAEDYVVKPFSPRELMYRVKVILNRTGQKDMPSLEVGPIRIHPEEYRVFINNEEIQLTQTEFKILMLLMSQPNVVKTREQILNLVWNEDAENVLDRTVDAQVKRLRSKLGEARDHVETVRGIGYRFTP